MERYRVKWGKNRSPEEMGMGMGLCSCVLVSRERSSFRGYSDPIQEIMGANESWHSALLFCQV